MINSTIAAISSGLTEAGISVIRISGSDAIGIGEKVFRSVSGKKLSEMSGYTCALGKVISNKRAIDECIATVFRAPRSYTGEDIVELSCHGGIAVTRDTLRAVLDAGATLAQPGEFTKRAFLNGKMDLIEAESVMNLISAKSSGEAQAALSVKEGYISKQVNEIKAELMNLAAHLNAWADYPEEDIPAIEPEHLKNSLINASYQLRELLRKYDAGKLMNNGINTVIVGRPNVGKSTLMNLLSGHDRSIVTDVPGTTRDTVEEQIQLGDFRLNLIDTAGIHDTDDTVEKIGVERAQKKLETAQFVVFIVDLSVPLSADDEHIYKMIPSDIPVYFINNKSDRCTGSNMDDYDGLREKYPDKNVITAICTSLKNEGDRVKNNIEYVLGRYFLGRDFSYASDVISYNERQRSLTDKTKAVIDEAVKALSIGETLDAVTVLIEEAVGYLAELTGENVTDEVVDRVFHNFCVGK